MRLAFQLTLVKGDEEAETGEERADADLLGKTWSTNGPRTKVSGHELAHRRRYPG